MPQSEVEEQASEEEVVDAELTTSTINSKDSDNLKSKWTNYSSEVLVNLIPKFLEIAENSSKVIAEYKITLKTFWNKKYFHKISSSVANILVVKTKLKDIPNGLWTPGCQLALNCFTLSHHHSLFLWLPPPSLHTAELLPSLKLKPSNLTIYQRMVNYTLSNLIVHVENLENMPEYTNISILWSCNLLRFSSKEMTCGSLQETRTVPISVRHQACKGYRLGV